MLLLTTLVACDAGGAALSDVSASTVEIVPGSTGIGKPPSVVEVRYRLGQAGDVTARLDGPVKATLLSGRQEAGNHVLRFSGVVSQAEMLGTGASIQRLPEGKPSLVRSVVPAGEYTIAISAGDKSESVRFRVREPQKGNPTPPDISNILVSPQTISPNSDAIDDVAEITFRTDQTATLSVGLTSPDGRITPVLAPAERAGGEQSVILGGQSALGEVLPDGTYTVTIRVQDQLGNRVEAERPLKIEGGGTPAIRVVKVEITPRQIIAGQAISVSVTLENIGNVPLRTQGPDRGYTYTTNDSYASIEGNKWTDKAGLWRVGVDWDGNRGGPPYRYPYRWGFGKTLMPGETVTTGGQIVILKEERLMLFYAGVLQEGISIVLDRLGRTPVEVDF